MSRVSAALLYLLVAGCSGPETAPVHASSSGAEHASSSPAAETSEHRVGDYVVYRYSGTFSEAPVVLREDITEARGLRLSIDVRSTRGDEERRWIQVVTDTAHNRENNVVDELYEVVEGERRLLDNVDNSDILRLYDWTLPPCAPPVEPLEPEARTLSVAGDRFDCTCDRQRMQCGEQTSILTECECPDFVWGHAFGEVAREGEDEPFWLVEVVEHGRGD